MPISDDLMQSILSMDSYNRGYGAGDSFQEIEHVIGTAHQDDFTTFTSLYRGVIADTV
ncbi:MAG: hypothetical protein HRT94_00340 [Alphaproteobacteria bacterium]|nr:hypothetical protein [Alphaproteobacteria bacterium]